MVRRLWCSRLRRAVDGVVARQTGLRPTTNTALVLTPRRCVLRVECADGRGFVAKGATGDRLNREVRAHRWAVEAGLPVAPLVGVFPGPPQVMLTEELSGAALKDADDPAVWRQAGALLRRLHDVPRPWPVQPDTESRDDWHARVAAQVARAAERAAFAPSLAQLVSETVASDAPLVSALSRSAVVHGDCMPAHLLWDGDGQLHLIDLEYLRIDDPAWDLAVLCAFEPARLDDVLAGYDPDAGEEHRLRQLVPPRRLERLVRAINWRIDHGQPIEPVLATLEHHLDAVGLREPGAIDGNAPGAVSR